MTVYVLLWEDRHSGPEVMLFSSQEKAIEHAQSIVRDYGGKYPEDYNETLTDSMRRAGWLYHGIYSCEGDCVTVFPKEIH